MQVEKLALVNKAICLCKMHEKMSLFKKETPKIEDVTVTAKDLQDLQHKHDNFNTVISCKRSACDKL